MTFGSPSTAELIRTGVLLSQKGDYEASAIVFKDIQTEDASLDFYRLVNAFKNNKKAEVEKLADKILHGFGVQYPQRYLDLTRIMLVESEHWKYDSNDLGDISREMNKITDRLKNNKGGPETQKIQKAVLARLDKMIKNAEDKQQKDKDDQEKKDKEKAEAQQPGQGGYTPAPDTVPGQDRGEGQVDKKKVREIAEVWGKLPEKERAQAMRELMRSMPAKDRAVVEKYLREIQKRSGGK